MGKNLVEIIVTAEDKASGVLNGIGGALRTVGTVALGGIGVATGALAGFAAGVTSLASAAAPVAGLKQGFEALTSSMQGGSAAMLSALQDASGGLITNTDLMQSFNTAASLVSKDFAEQLPDAMGHLSKVAASTGQDMNYMLDSLVKGVGRLSPMILDNLGIQVNLTEANEIYAASVGKSVDELTKAEQQTALMNQVMEKLADNTEGMEGLSNPFEKFKVTMANLKDEIGLKLLPVVAPMMERFGELAVRVIPLLMRGVERLIGGMQPVMAIFDSIAVAVGQFIDAISRGESPLDALINAIMRFGVEMGVPSGKLKEIRTSIEGFMTKVMEAKDRVLEFIAPIVESISQFVSWKDVLIAAAIGIGAIVIPAIISIVTSLAPVLLVIGAVIAIVALLRNAWESDFGGIQGKTAEVIAFVRQIIQAGLDWIKSFWDAHGAAILATAQRFWGLIRDFIDGIIQTIYTIFQAFRALFQGDWETFGKKILEVWQTAWRTVANFLSGLWDMVKPWLTSLWNRVRDWFTTTDWAGLGRRIIDGIVNGLNAAGNLIMDKLMEFARSAWQAVMNFFTGGGDEERSRRGGVKGGGGALSVEPPFIGSGSIASTKRSAVASGGQSVVVNIDARGAAKGVDRDVRRVVEDVMRDYGLRADMRIRTGG